MPDTPKKADQFSRAARTLRVNPETTVTKAITRNIAVEAPVSIEFNGIGYAVMMATPADLEDFVTGFALTERLIETVDQINDIHGHQAENGWIVRSTLSADKADAVFERARMRVSESGCGICGIENLEMIARALPVVTGQERVERAAIFRALDRVAEHQPANMLTGCHHAAAWADMDGEIGCVREDVGRHNALDKVIGAMVRRGQSLSPGFILTTSRCSYEIVEKAVIAGASTLVTISAPTSLAIERADQAGLQLISLARADSFLDFSACSLPP